MNFYVIGITLFVGGFVVGALVCYVVMAQIYKHKRVKDELLKSKRAAIKAHRTLDRFVKTSLDMFGELDTTHRQYLQFLRETTQKIAPKESGLHHFLEDDMGPMPVYRGKEEKAPAKQIETEDKIETIKSSIPAPDVLKNPILQTEDTIDAEDTETSENPKVPVEEPKKEIKEEEPLKV
ncbi:Protein of unknown function [Succinivibrio dextrinosolvens]|uniref:ZapG family protein n=1 Tax=Succinivibrio dextrinosolvens TaxID=83771 RepID=UPI0008EEB44D|nr:DUF1043 family protein [Succinivibrio dextrinosolvens]SFS41753.1 Protein of unknown function [Succinivibrio dextrinosolvens]